MMPKPLAVDEVMIIPHSKSVEIESSTYTYEVIIVVKPRELADFLHPFDRRYSWTKLVLTTDKAEYHLSGVLRGREQSIIRNRNQTGLTQVYLMCEDVKEFRYGISGKNLQMWVESEA